MLGNFAGCRFSENAYRVPPLMTRIAVSLAALAVLSVVVGLVVLATWDIPAPTATVETVIPNDRFPR